MNIEIIKNEIKNWFLTQRPDLYENDEITKDFINSIYSEIESEIQDLEKSASIIIIREFLRLYYSSIVFDLLDEIVTNEPYDKTFNEFKDIGFMYRTEMAVILKMVSKERLVEKFGNNPEELRYNQDFINELKRILDIYMLEYNKS